MSLAGLPLELFLYMFGLLAGITTLLLKGIGSVPEGERGVKCRWGRAIHKKNSKHDIRDPGLVLLIPFVDTLVKRHVREQTSNLVDQKITLKDGFIIRVSAIILFKITDVYKALFEVDNLGQSLENVALRIIQNELSPKTYDDLITGQLQLSGDAFNKLSEIVVRWGVELIEFGLTDSDIIPEQAHLVSMGVGASIKLGILEALAKKLDLESTKDVPSGLAAAMIGIPIVSTVNADRKVVSFQSVADPNASDEEKQESTISMLKFLSYMITSVGKKLKP